MEEFYPMPMFVNLKVADIERSIKWYQEALGFRQVFRNTGMVHLRRERFQDLLLFPSVERTSIEPGNGMVIQFQAGKSSVAEIAHRVRQQDSAKLEGPLEQPWNVREVTIQDPDGYRLRFSEPIDVSLQFDQVMGEN
ncbi:MAG: VOC family protein [Chloroflexota bacterium]|nr:MAG: VOC family protein [Chloroflexota bacterium]